MGLNSGRGSIERSRLRRSMPWLAVAVFIACGYASVLPPRPVSATAPDDRFSAERAIVHVGAIAKRPHPMGTTAIAEVRGYLVAELERLGIAVRLQAFTRGNYFGRGEPVRVVNIIGRIPGTANTRAVALLAHYDTVPTTPGANDNSAAVAALLETGRALRAGPSLRNDVYLILTDGEEPAPRFGAGALVSDRRVLERIGLVVNLEASGRGGPSLLAETSGPERWLVDELARADPLPAAFSVLTGTTRLLGDLGTDFDAFRNAGVTGFHFAYLHGSPIYHTDADNLDSVTRGSLQHHGEHALGIARHFGRLDLTEARPSDAAVYFTVGPLLVRYPAGWAIPLAVVALVIGAVGQWRRSGTRATAAAAVALRLLRTLAAGLLGAVAGTLIWLFITTTRSTPGAIESYLYLACILAVAVWVAARIARNREGHGRYDPVWVWIALALLTALWLPGFSYLFTWPALALVGSALLWRRAEPTGAGRALRFCLVAAPTLILMTPTIDFFFQFALPRPGNPGSEMKTAIALPLLLTVLAAGSLKTAWPLGRLSPVRSRPWEGGRAAPSTDPPRRSRPPPAAPR